MALPPLELFSLMKRSPCCRAASSCLRRDSKGRALRGGELPGRLDEAQSVIASFPALQAGACFPHQADVAQLVEQLIRNQ